MTTLSRIWLNPLRAGGQRLLASPQRLHAAVLGGFPDRAQNDRVLWRIEPDPHRPTLLVLGPGRPDWSHIVEQAGWPDADVDHARVADYASLLAQVVDGREFRFRLRANPVQSLRPAEPGPDGRYGRYSRTGHRTEGHQRRWFLERTAGWGFTVVNTRPNEATNGAVDEHDLPGDVRITHRERLSFTKNASDRRVIVQTATFEGRLTVTDAGALREALLGGIGPAKAYGCGLLTLAPA